MHCTFSVSVAEDTAIRTEREQVRAGLGTLSALQQEAYTPACYDGATYRQLAHRLDVALGAVKTHIREGLIRLPDCRGPCWR